MPVCYYCEEEQRSYFSYYCKDCSMLRRLLLINNPKKCIDILKRTLTRDSKQIDFKINQEIKKIVLNELPTIKEEEHEDKTDSSYMTRSKIKK